MEIEPVIIVPVIFATIYATIKLFVRRKERLLMIEKGIDMPKLKDDNYLFSTLKLGLFLIGIGLGFLVGNILTHTTTLQVEVSYFSMIFMFGGIALIIGYILEDKKKDKPSGF